MITVPSGRVFDGTDVNILKRMHENGFVRYSEAPFKLKSGIMSHVYVFGREDLTDHPDLEVLVGRKIAYLVWENSLPGDPQPCLIGLPTAGTVLAQAAAMVSLDHARGQNPVICHRVMREALKEHGAHNTWVNGKPDLSRHTYWTVDNVVTDGDTKLKGAEKLEQDGYPSKGMPTLIWVDRQQGGIKCLEQAGFKRIVVAYYLLDITFALGELGLWPKETVQAVQEEIQAHQFPTVA